jgi:peptidoglycan/LPS O-acetylase OafA/YrhL
MFVTIVAGFLIWFRHHFWHSTPAGRLDAHAFFEQMFMVQLWTSPRAAGTSWAGPGWSLSAEWLAYLVFPLLALVALRLHRLVKARWLMVASLVVLAPLVLVVLQDGTIAGDHTWLLRIVTEFTSGVLLCTAMSRLELTDRQRRLGGLVAMLSVLGVVAMLYSTRWGAPHATGLLVVVLFPVLIGALAIGRGPLVSLLSTRALVLGGGLSYSLYLIHGPALHLYRDATRYTSVAHLPRDARYYGELVFIAVLVAVAWAVFRWVEEPSRRLMRRMLDHEFPPAAHAIIPARGQHDQHVVGERPAARVRELDPSV